MSEHDHGDGHDDLPVAARVRRLEERLIAAGLTSDEEIDAFLGTLYASASPVNGARMAARAWTDPAYRELLLSDGNAAAAESGFGPLSYRLRAESSDGLTGTPFPFGYVDKETKLRACQPLIGLSPRGRVRKVRLRRDQ